MREFKRFDPLDWFVSASFAVLSGSVALVLAIHLLAVIWVPLVIGVTSVLGLGAIIRVLVWWHRRQLW